MGHFSQKSPIISGSFVEISSFGVLKSREICCDEGVVANQLVVVILFSQIPKIYLQDPGVLEKYSFHQK